MPSESHFVTQFFGNSSVGDSVGSLFEATVSNSLKRSGFRPWPIADLVGDLNIRFGGQKNKFASMARGHTDSTQRVDGEIDAIVVGDSQAWTTLCALCPHNQNRIDVVDDTPFILLVEAKLTKKTLVNELVKKGNLCSDHWLLSEKGANFEHRAVFINEGDDSVEWIANGGDSKFQLSDRVAWQALKDASISVFFMESFSQEWVIDISESLRTIRADLSSTRADLSSTRAELSSTLARLTVLEDLVSKLGGSPGASP